MLCMCNRANFYSNSKSCLFHLCIVDAKMVARERRNAKFYLPFKDVLRLSVLHKKIYACHRNPSAFCTIMHPCNCYNYNTVQILLLYDILILHNILL